MTTPLLGVQEVSEGVVNQATAHNTALRQLEALLVRALSKDTATPPGSPASGDSYIVPAGATGEWAGKDNQIAAFIGGAWSYFVATEGIRLWVVDLGAEYVFTEGAWATNGGGDIAVAIAAHAAESDPHTGYQKESEKGAADGYASLDSGGKLPVAQLPNLAVIDFLGTAANQAAMLALSGQKGDWCARSDTSTVYVITGSDPTLIGSWTALSYPTGTGGTVTSVALTTPGLLFDVAGSPVTAAGTLAMTLKTQAANRFLAGPTTGADAAPTMRALVATDLPSQPFDVHAFYPGIPTASAKVLRIPIARAVTFPANFAGSYFTATANATGTTVCDVQKNGSSIGSVSIAAGGTTATFTTTSGTSKSFAAGDILSIIAPASPDATLADPGFVLAGSR